MVVRQGWSAFPRSSSLRTEVRKRSSLATASLLCLPRILSSAPPELTGFGHPFSAQTQKVTSMASRDDLSKSLSELATRLDSLRGRL